MDEIPLDCHDDDDMAANQVERRLFAAISAVKSAERECDLMRRVMDSAIDAWRCSRRRLADLEMLRDALGTQLSTLEMRHGEARRPPESRMLSAA